MWHTFHEASCLHDLVAVDCLNFLTQSLVYRPLYNGGSRILEGCMILCTSSTWYLAVALFIQH